MVFVLYWNFDQITNIPICTKFNEPVFERFVVLAYIHYTIVPQHIENEQNLHPFNLVTTASFLFRNLILVTGQKNRQIRCN